MRDSPTNIEDLELVESYFDSIDSSGSSIQGSPLDDDALVEATGDNPHYKVKSLVDVYERCSLVVVEPNSHYEASQSVD